MSAQPNDHGVYEPGELLTHDLDKKGWQGVPVAEIALIDLGDRWLWSADFHLYSDADSWGHGEPLTDWPSHRAANRAAAIEAAAAFYRNKLTERAGKGSRDCRRILAWLDTLQPVQAELFA